MAPEVNQAKWENVEWPNIGCLDLKTCPKLRDIRQLKTTVDSVLEKECVFPAHQVTLDSLLTRS